MRAGKFFKTSLAAGGAAALLVACAAAPPAPALPPQALTKQQVVEMREQDIQEAVTAAYRAGDDGLLLDMNLHLAWCQHDAQEITDKPQRSAALQQCRSDWPQPLPGQQRPFTTSR